MGERLTDQDCFICGVGRLPHQMGEETGDIKHAFSLDSKMERSTVRTGGDKKARPAVMITVVPTPDLALRKLLIERGIINADDLVDSVPGFTAQDLGLES